VTSFIKFKIPWRSENARHVRWEPCGAPITLTERTACRNRRDVLLQNLISYSLES
jgi:hypothetical protein